MGADKASAPENVEDKEQKVVEGVEMDDAEWMKKMTSGKVKDNGEDGEAEMDKKKKDEMGGVMSVRTDGNTIAQIAQEEQTVRDRAFYLSVLTE